MIVYVAQSRTAGGLAEQAYQVDVSIAPTLSEQSVNRTPSGINAVPICAVVQNRMSNHMLNRMSNRMLTNLSEPNNQTPSENNAVPIVADAREE